jgi:glycine C-acetyltransferase
MGKVKRRHHMKIAYSIYEEQLEGIRESGTYKDERIITTPQKSRIDTTAAKGVVNMCANNYLGLSDDPRLIEAAKKSYDEWGFGLSSVRFICGTQDIHKQLERRIADFVGMEDAILYSSCFDANGGLFETLLGPEDAVISDELNHASIIDGIRLCKAKRLRYHNNDMEDLRLKLEEAKDCRIKLIATDGVFSMDGYIANLKGICDLADEYGALVMVDDSHAVGFMGEHGRGTAEHCHVMGRVDIITGTFGKAMGGASGGYTAARKEIVDLLRQRSRPYLFSNALAPAICAASIKTIDILEESTELRDRVHENANYFRRELSKLGFDLLPGEHPIVPIMLYDAKVAKEFADRVLEKGVYVTGFSYPVVPMGKARVRTQISAGHTKEDLDFAVRCFGEVKKEMGI